MNELNLENKIIELLDIAENQKRTLYKLDQYLGFFKYCESETDRNIFIDCSMEQQDALDMTNDILKILRLLESNLKDN